MGDTRTYLKNNLSAHGSVTKRFKMLTYYVYAPSLFRAPDSRDFAKLNLRFLNPNLIRGN
jgi:hypothetical protein